jgi:predicted GNAT family N-acyltransferase
VIALSPRSSVSIALARTEEDRRAAFALRYEVFTEEQGDERYADAREKTFKDELDTPHAIIFVAKNPDNDVVGTIRLTSRSRQAFIGDFAYGFPVLAGLMQLPCAVLTPQCCVIGRGVVRRDYRGGRTFHDLLKICENHAKAEGNLALIAVVGEHNFSMSLLLKHDGWRPYPVSSSRRGWKGFHLFKDLRSLNDG